MMPCPLLRTALGHPSRALPLALWLALSCGAVRAETLAQAWEAAQAVDHGLRSAQERTAAAAETVGAAKSARWPQLSVEAGRTAMADSPAIQADLAGQPLQIPVAERYSTAYRAMATLPLFSGGRVGQGIESATASLDAARLAEAGSIQDLRLRVAEAYVGVLRAGRFAALAERHAGALDAHAREIGRAHV
jgi:outer membrane protein TolC